MLTNEHLNLINLDGTINPDVWGIGDCAQIEGAVLPATAQGWFIHPAWKQKIKNGDKFTVANQKAKYLVKKLNKLAKDQDSPKPFKFENQGSLAYIGDWYGLLYTL